MNEKEVLEYLEKKRCEYSRLKYGTFTCQIESPKKKVYIYTVIYNFEYSREWMIDFRWDTLEKIKYLLDSFLWELNREIFFNTP